MSFKIASRAVLGLAGLWIFVEVASHVGTEILWFQELGYSQVYLLRLKTRVALWAIATTVTSSFWLGNLAIADRLKYPPHRQGETLKPQRVRRSSVASHSRGQLPMTPSPLELPWLLLLVLLLSLVMGLMVIHWGQIAARAAIDFELPDILLPLPTKFGFDSIWPMAKQIPSRVGELSLLLGVVLALLINPRWSLKAIALLMSLAFGLIASNHWAKVLQYFHPVKFNITDPLFNQDISFYIFSLPIIELLTFSLAGLFLYGLISCTLIYLLSGNSLSQGRFPGLSHLQQRHLYGLGAALMVAVALRYWQACYKLLFSKQGVTYGASYTDVTMTLPVMTLLSILALGTALFLAAKALNFIQVKQKTARMIFLLILFNFSWGVFLPILVQRLVVQPNEFEQEKFYIERSIAFTKKAFDIQDMEVKTFEPEGKLTKADLKENQLTIRNIRLWDKRPLLQTNRQLQQIRPYYKFPDADIDRYTLKKDKSPKGEIESQQVIIAARELDYTAVAPDAKTWVNKNLVYTHGYGFTMSPVNTVGAGGLPDYFVKDIEATQTIDSQSNLEVRSGAVQKRIPMSKPRIYYGEITDTEVMVVSKEKEFDYPSGNENVYNIYDGSGGVAIGSSWQRWLFAARLNNWQMVVTPNFTPQTKILFRRNINQRVRAIAPFLRYDSDPYLVAANTNLYGSDRQVGEIPLGISQNNLYWMIDAYTTSDRYPYSDPGEHSFNYIRNSVKVTIDAFNGSVNFYVADFSDPIIHSWMSIFPGLFKPLKEMPATLRTHIRYPVDLFKIQSERLLTYHMEDPQVFYNREDLWRVPNEIYGSEQQLVEPYYLIMRLPTETSEEFILLLPFTPASRNNLIAWLAARSDGDNYGKLLLYQFPKQRLVYGPEQIEALINQTPEISEQISLWNRQGSKAIQGNLLVIPIEQSLLYVEPLYLEASQNSLPTLVRVIVAYENRIVMAETLNKALKAIFQKQLSHR